MKRVNLVILVALLLGAVISQPAFAQGKCKGKADFVIKKGKVIDYDGDGVWDFMYFTLKQKDPALEIPVTCIDIFSLSGDFPNVPFNDLRITKKKTLYLVDLRDMNLSGSFSTEIVVDTSNLPSSDSDGSGGIDSDDDIGGAPGGPGGPKETVIIIDYP